MILLSRLSAMRITFVLAFAWLGTNPANAQLRWDPNSTPTGTPANDNGSGSWNTTGGTSANWSNGTIDSGWSSPNLAVFGVTGDTNASPSTWIVSVDTAGMTVSGLTFNVGGYSITGGTSSNSLGFSSIAPTIAVNNTGTTSISAVLTGASITTLSVTSTTTGTLVLSGANTFSGTTNGAAIVAIGAGATLSITNDNVSGLAGSLGAAPSAASNTITMASGSTLNLGTGTWTLNSNRGILLGASTGALTENITTASGASVTYNGIIVNNGSSTDTLVFGGSGTAILGGTSTYSAFTLNSGTVQTTASNSTSGGPLGKGTITLAGGTLQYITSGATGISIANTTIFNNAVGPVTIALTGVNLDVGITISQPISISGGPTINIPRDRVVFSGVVTLNSDLTISSGATSGGLSITNQITYGGTGNHTINFSALNTSGSVRGTLSGFGSNTLTLNGTGFTFFGSSSGGIFGNTAGIIQGTPGGGAVGPTIDYAGAPSGTSPPTVQSQGSSFTGGVTIYSGIAQVGISTTATGGNSTYPTALPYSPFGYTGYSGSTASSVGLTVNGGTITPDAAFVRTVSNVLLINGNANYGGTSGSTLTFNSDSQSIAPASGTTLSMTVNGTVNFNPADPISTSYVVIGSSLAQLTLAGNGAATLGPLDFQSVGHTFVITSTGSVKFGNVSTNTNLANNATATNTLTINSAGAVTFGTTGVLGTTPIINVSPIGAGITAILNLGVNETIGALTLSGTTATSIANVNVGTTGLTLGGDVTANNANSVISTISGTGNLTINGARNFNIASGDAVIINAIIANGSSGSINNAGAGTLILNNSVSVPVTVSAGTLKGTGTFRNAGSALVSLSSGTTIRAGSAANTSTIGVMTFGYGLTVPSGATIAFQIANGTGTITPFTGTYGVSTQGTLTPTPNPTNNNFYYITINGTGSTGIASGALALLDLTGVTDLVAGSTYSFQVGSGFPGTTAGTVIPSSNFTFIDPNNVAVQSSAFLYTNGSGGIFVNFTAAAAPEPVALLPVSLLMLGCVRQLRRRAIAG